jgi:hypothetical protein
VGQVLMAGLAYAFAEDDEWRRVLPRGFFQAMGAVHADTTDNPTRTEIQAKAQGLLQKLLGSTTLPLDAAADQMAAEFLHSSLPPYSGPVPSVRKKKKKKAHHRSEAEDEENEGVKVSLDSKVRLASATCARLAVQGEDEIFLYYNTRNDREYQKVPPLHLEFPIEAGPALEYLFDCYPDFTPVRAFPELEFDEDKVQVASALASVGVLQVLQVTK